MSTEKATFLEVKRLIRADPATVFRAWTDPEQMMRWSCPEGVMLDKVDVDLRIGGRYALHMVSSEGQTYTAVGEYREVEVPERLVYTWDWVEEDHRVGETIVTVRFTEVDGATEVVVRHELFPSVEARDGHAQGWGSCLDRLEAMFV